MFITTPGADDGGPGAHTLGAELTRISGGSLAGVFAGHLHVAPERDDADLVDRLPDLFLDQGRAEAEAERLDLHVGPLGDQEMAEFVHEDDDANARDHQKHVIEAV